MQRLSTRSLVCPLWRRLCRVVFYVVVGWAVLAILAFAIVRKAPGGVDDDEKARKKADHAGRVDQKRTIVFVAGQPSHGPMEHEYHAGCMLLANKLRAFAPDWDIRVFRDEWPKDESAFDGVDAIVLYCDGGRKHLALPHLDRIDRMVDRGVGLVFLHYALEAPQGEAGEKFLKWVGGYFDSSRSICTFWKTGVVSLPEHPITRGVKPFEVDDEFYFDIRFREKLKGVTPILTAIPPEEAFGKRTVREPKNAPQHVAWAGERENGSRGFGFTGGHFHKNWADDDMRRVVLNAIVWTAKADAPENGVVSTVTVDELKEHLDPKSAIAP